MKKKISIWQLTIVLFTVCMLALSALPTLFGKQDIVNIQGRSKEHIVPSATDLNNLLVKHGLEVSLISSNAQGSQLLLVDKLAKANEVKSLLATTLGSNYNVRIDEVSASPNWLQAMGFSPIKLGLDLYGGVLFVLHVDTEVARAEHTQSAADEISQFIRDSRLRGISVTTNTNQDIKIKLSPRASAQGSWTALNSFIGKQFTQFNVDKSANNIYTLQWQQLEIDAYRQALMQQSVSIMRKRIESLGITEAAIQRQGKDHIRIELPGIKDPEQAKEIIGTTATLDIYAKASPGVPQKVFTDQQGNAISVQAPSVFGGNNIKSASAGTDEMGMPLVNLILDQQGGDKMSRFSKANIGHAMVTVFSQYSKDKTGQLNKQSEVINVATVLSQLGNRFSITNMSSPQAAQQLATLIRAGSLNAPLSIVQQRTINPTLGEENVANGFAALALGVSLTMLFMAMWYRTLGMLANVSLLINLVCLLGLMAWLPGIVLTLPGIAGLVLTVGMAVDTNVLIFERIKEEVNKNRQALHAIEAGYKRAFTTILDANLTTMICAVILMSMGNGPVRGFAMTLCLGLITSLFSGVFVARLLTQLLPARVLVKHKEIAQ
ncbi:protein translocase subunit SecD [Glaciecola sp. SC05]|uniref:protein translocase subunit SecD n=1 Tax=Glaciecola sp. SC05 TaxID=1987355 RepID=UPI003526E6C8